MASVSIPEEVLVSEIFVKLPASCIVTLRSVCRSWRRLTKEHSFVRTHMRNHRADAVSQLDGGTTKGGELRMLKLDADNDISTFNIRTVPGSGPILHLKASCDGLLCFQQDREEEPKHYYVCNPVAWIWTTVTASARDAASQDRYLCGFYFHRSTGEYRLLHCLLSKVADQTLLRSGVYEVATVGGEDKSWRSICKFSVTEDRVSGPSEDCDGAKVLALFAFKNHRSTAVNGRLYWHNKTGVIMFDTESEKFSWISVPIDQQPNGFSQRNLQMNKILGNLCLIRTSGKRYCKMELWMLKDQRQWVELYTVVHDRRGQGLELTVHDGEEGDGELLVRWDMDYFGLYDFKLRTCKRMTITPTADINARSYECDLLSYTHSLVDPRTNLS